MSRSDDLAAAQDTERATRERRTATKAALLELLRTGGPIPSDSALAKFTEERRDGTRATLREPGTTHRAGPTNQADHITHAPRSIENQESYPMSTFTRDTAHTRARDLTRDLTKVGVTLPADVTTAQAALKTHLDRGTPRAPDEVALSEAYVDGATDKQIDTLVAAHLAGRVKSTAYSEGSKRLGLRVMAAITSNGDHLTRQLANIAAPLIEKLNQAAALPTTDVAALVRTGDSAGADLAARLEVIAGDLTPLYKLRRAATRGAEYGQGGWDAGTWRNPRVIREAENLNRLRPTMSPAERFLIGLQIGGDLWFPTPGEAESVAAGLLAEDRDQKLADEAHAWRHGTRASVSRPVTA